jgi:hypothetical protein
MRMFEKRMETYRALGYAQNDPSRLNLLSKGLKSEGANVSRDSVFEITAIPNGLITFAFPILFKEFEIISMKPLSNQGGNPFKKQGESHDDIFSKPKWPTGVGASRPRPKDSESSQPEDEVQPLLPENSDGKKFVPKVVLANLKWSAGSGEFNEKISVLADAVLPEDAQHLTRIEFKVYAFTPDGKRENIDKQEGHLRDGSATAEFTLYWPQYRKDGNPLSECDFIFTAKHRESKEEESGTLRVTGPKEPIGKIWVKLVNRKGNPLSGLECELKGKKQSFPKKKLDEAGAAIWEDIPLDEYRVEFKSGSSLHQQLVPWLAKDGDLHVQRVKEISGSELLRSSVSPT